jgi:bifunctional non-homologous end joining protein LigD
MAASKRVPGKKAPFPQYTIMPMLATLVDKPFDTPGWSYEVKWDGYRAISYLNNGVVEIRSRNNKPFSEKYYPLKAALEKLKLNAVFDGEIIVINEKGISDFSLLQNWRSEADGQLVFYIFDILWYDGYDVTGIPFKERHELLTSVFKLKVPDTIRISQLLNTTGKDFFAVAQEMGLEGIIAKQQDSLYLPGIRSKSWLKIKTEKRQEVIVGGYTKNQDTKKLFSALLLGIYENGVFNFAGTVGTGFNQQIQQEILKILKPLEQKKCPFSVVPDYNKPSRFRPNPPPAEVTWVKPVLVVEISYREMTRDGSLRHPSFKGIRYDKEASEVVMEIPEAIEPVPTPVADKNLFIPPVADQRQSLLNPNEETQVKKIKGRDLKFTNLSKIFWPEEKYTKRDFINYYYQVAPYMLPHMKNRPQTLLRHPNGYKGKAFFQKDVTGKVPSWIQTYKYYSEADEREKHFLVCTDEASLLYIASLGCIEMNPWSSTVNNPDNPDWCIIDLDPAKTSFEQVIKAAQVTKKILDAIDVTSYCKTSGSTGIHLYIPFGAKYTYEDSKEFGRKIARIVHNEIPSFTSIERLTDKRGGKMYVDFLQNRPQATVASVYSVRPKPGATVSMPLHWDEVKKGLQMKDFTIRNSIERIRTEGDLFKGVLGKGINLQQTLKKIKTVFDL